MPLLEKSKPSSEKDLHIIIEKELDALEEGLVLLKHEFPTKKGIIDFLCVDSGGSLVIVEVKLHEDDNILFQALRYFNEIDKNHYFIGSMYSDKYEIDLDEEARIILIAEHFSDDLRRLTLFVKPYVELFEYTVLRTPDGSEGIYFHPLSLPSIKETPSPPLDVSDLRDYITKDELKPIFDNFINEVTGINDSIEVYSTQSYVGFKYRNRQIGWIEPFRKAFDVGAVTLEKNGRVSEYEYERIEIVDVDYTEIIDFIKESYTILNDLKSD